MRSEERSGIVFIIMLLLWGTLVTEPFHILAGYFYKGILTAGGALKFPEVVTSLLVVFIFTVCTVLLQRIAKSEAAPFIPGILAVLTLVGFIARTAYHLQVDVGKAAALIIPVVILMVLYIFRLKKVLIWIAEAYIFSLPIALITATLFEPVARLGETVRKILYITRYNEMDVVTPFDGLAGIPGIAWGVFFTVLAALPVIFFATQKKRETNLWIR